MLHLGAKAVYIYIYIHLGNIKNPGLYRTFFWDSAFVDFTCAFKGANQIIFERSWKIYKNKIFTTLGEGEKMQHTIEKKQFSKENTQNNILHCTPPRKKDLNL